MGNFTPFSMHQTQTKQSIRKEVKAKRLKLSPERIDEASMQIAKSVSALEAFSEASILFLYAAFPFEVQTRGLHELALRNNKKVAYPKICPATREMHFYEVSNINELIGTPYGNKVIDEPSPKIHKQVVPTAKDFVVVPGVAFDTKKSRLGYGGGFYDRYLKKYSPYTIGIGFHMQLIAYVPIDDWDQPLNCVITEKEIIF